MKQKGQTWITHDGKETLARYLPPHEKLFEKNGQRIASKALELEKLLREAKQEFVDLCKEALRNNPDQNVTRRLTFYTFDREFRIEYDLKEQYVRVYRATKSNPSVKDYELINLDLNRFIAIDSAPSVAEPEATMPLPPLNNVFPRTNSADELNAGRVTETPLFNNQITEEHQVKES